VKRCSRAVGGHKTSISREDIFWASLGEIARERAATLPELAGLLDAARGVGNLSSTVRVLVLDHYRNNVEATRNAARESRLHQAPATRAQAP